MIRTIIRRLTTDVDALRLENATLTAAVSKAIKDRQLSEAMAAQFKSEVDRLRALAGNLGPTPAEAELLALVVAEPGKMAREYGRASHIARAEKALAEYEGEPPHYHWALQPVTESDAADESRPLSALHKKGLVRRERAGQSYRYWPVGGVE